MTQHPPQQRTIRSMRRTAWLAAWCALLLMTCAALRPLPLWAGPAEEFDKHHAAFQELAKDGKNGEYRSSWQALETAFLSIYKQNPRGAVAAKSLYYVGRVNEELGRRSSLATDYKVALDYYNRVVTRFPDHSWADDALWRMAQVQYQHFHNYDEARKHCKTGIAKFAKGDMRDRFAQLLTTLEKNPQPPSAPARKKEDPPGKQPEATQIAAQDSPGGDAAQEARQPVQGRSAPLAEAVPAPAPQASPKSASAKDAAGKAAPGAPAPAAEASAKAAPATSAPALAPAPAPVSAPAPAPAPAPGGRAQLLAVRHQSTDDYTRVILVLDKPAHYTQQTLPPAPDKNLPHRLYLDLKNVQLGRGVSGDLAIADGNLRRVRTAQNSPDVTRVVLDLQTMQKYKVFAMDTAEDHRLVVDVYGGAAPKPPTATTPAASPAPAPAAVPAPAPAPAAVPAPAPQPVAQPVIVKKPSKQGSRVPGESATASPGASPTASPGAPAASQPQPAPTPLVAPTPAPAPAPAVPAKPTSEKPDAKPAQPAKGQAYAPPGGSAKQAGNLVEQLGLTVGVIMLDPGHGGKDPGAFVGNVYEKDINLNFAKILGKLLEKEGFEVLYTRTTDTFIPLEERTAMANLKKADVFISIHVNAYSSDDVHGLETYYLDLATSDDAVRVAARENAVSTKKISDLQFILTDLMLNAKMKESRELAKNAHKNILSTAAKKRKIKDMGVRSAPFYVLMGARMPSILVELGYITNSAERANLTSESHLTRQAQGLVTGILQYKKQIERFASL